MEKLHIMTLGCSKNTVDSEYMLGLLNSSYELTADVSSADTLIINTCTFIEDAKKESIEAIFEAVNLKEAGMLKKIVLAGCLSQRYAEELMKEIPEIDLFVGTSNYDQIVELLNEHIDKIQIDDPSRNIPEHLPRILTESRHYAYLKISEGCDNNCTYCIIPKVRGRYRSRSIQDIMEEVAFLSDQGIKELIIIAQDTSKYGIDIYGEKRLHDLIREISSVEGIEWIRIHYIYPEDFYDDLIHEFAANDKLLKYFDIPLQHINDEILKKMNRKTNRKQIIELINKIRRLIDHPVIRTTFIVGFPGETVEQYEELKQFITDTRFERLGVFEFSEEEGTAAEKLPNKIDPEIKLQRRDDIMSLQQQISYENNLKIIGTKMSVIVDGEEDEHGYIGRTYMDSPEIDGVVYIQSNHELITGEIYEITITDATDYDLIGVYNELT
ncbi:MAG: 30S ribosomal protein S12 methylthiotransferase RimO [Tissierellales bacterium]|nr:30S ribosomal protein S12 methylthiotransferase RimO [Tissierellales bacterium]MBN2828312.1 30S ribosomal protein S12 methylthiotransferase RimO [Tissierellales bacterium]